MGHGIAQTFALKGYEVNLLSRSENSLKRAIREIEWSLNKFAEKNAISRKMTETVLSRIRPTTSYEEATKNIELAVETVSENMELKKQVFSKIDAIAPYCAIIVTNTSTLSITELGRATGRREKTAGMHWFNPPQLTQLIEVIKGDDTSSRTLNAVMEVSRRLGKTPILCKKDSRGFIVSRILVSVFNEAFWTYCRGEASKEGIDASTKYIGGFPMGWFELVDYVGVDIEHDVSKILYEAHGERFRTCREVTEPLVKEKKLGRKTTMGFYDWSKGRPHISSDLAGEYDIERSWAVAVNEAAWMVLDQVAKPESIDLGMKLGTGWASGPCEYADRKGLDLIMDKLEGLYNQYALELYKPCPLLKNYIAQGWSGKKTGRGFYKYG
jgi:enoyl-CoA hydratase/3-hydroxyacyl-CoA dehydrogenase